MKILITGGLGFIGSHLAESLDNGNNQIQLLTKSFRKKQNLVNSSKHIKIVKIDITNFSKIGNYIEKNKPDIIIHLAGQTSHSKSFEDPIKDIDVNARSTLFMLEKIRNINLKCKFVLGSSFIVIGKPLRLPINENSPCNPTTIYGSNRLASEHYCKIYYQVYGLDTMIFRITNSFGPREQIIPNKNAINYLIYKAFKGEDITIYNNGKFFRDLIYISDVVSAIDKILRKGKSGELYWISSAKRTWFYQIGNMLEKLTNARTKYVKPPKYTKKVDVGNFVVDNSKMKSLGWKPKISVKEGISKTLKYFEENKM